MRAWLTLVAGARKSPPPAAISSLVLQRRRPRLHSCLRFTSGFGTSCVHDDPLRLLPRTQIPTTGSISFLVQPSGITIGSAAVTPDSTLGSAYATIVGPGPTSSVYGQYTGDWV